MTKLIELEGYLYLVKNYYDQYDVDEVCFDEDISNVFYEDLDYFSKKNFEWGGYAYPLPEGQTLKEIKAPTYLTDILQKKLDLIPAEEEAKYARENSYLDKYTFLPNAKRVRITIEEIE